VNRIIDEGKYRCVAKKRESAKLLPGEYGPVLMLREKKGLG
jgi:hypothetical protein